MKKQLPTDALPGPAARPAGEKAPGICPDPALRTAPVTVIVPAFNESASISETIKSLLDQTLKPAEIIVVDDGSTDGTGQVARSLGVKVIRPPARTGSKAGAQTFALDEVQTEFTIAVDADTTLAPDAVEKLSSVFTDPAVAAACGSVLPRRIQTVWERGRYVEYLFAFTFYKGSRTNTAPRSSARAAFRCTGPPSSAGSAAGRPGRWPRTWT